MTQYISKSAIVAEIERRINFNEKLNAHSRLDECNTILSFLDTLEVKDVDLMLHTIIAEGCDWLALHTELSHEQIEDCRNLMLTIKDEQLKAQKGE